MFEELNPADILLEEQVHQLKQSSVPPTKAGDKKLKELQVKMSSDESFHRT
jgi:hypothetical protein